MSIESAVDVMEYLACANPVACGENCFSIEGIAVDAFNCLRAHEKGILTVIETILSVSATRSDVGEVLDEFEAPILRDHPHLALLVARPHFHENPIRSRWRFTFASNSTTRPTICGSGVP